MARTTERLRSAHKGRLVLGAVALLALSQLPGAARGAPEDQGGCSAAGVQTEVARGLPMNDRFAEEARDLSPGTRSLVFGDSTAARWPPGELDGIIGAPSVHLANGGDSIENTTWMVDQVNPSRATGVRTVLASVGTANLRTDDACAFGVKARALMFQLRSHFPRASIYFIGLYQKGLFGRALQEEVIASNDVFRRAAVAAGITYVNIYDPIAKACAGQASCTLFEPNRVHPSVAGYAVISQALRSVAHR